MREFDSIPKALAYARSKADALMGGSKQAQALVQKKDKILVMGSSGASFRVHKPMMIVRPARSGLAVKS